MPLRPAAAETLRTAAIVLVAVAAGWFLRDACTVAPPPDPVTPDPVTPDAAAESLRVEGPPVPAGDTARVDPADAAVAQPERLGAPQVAPSGLVIPVAGVEPEDLVDTFEDARGQGREHDAIDILAPRGTPVLAAADGTVLRLFTSVRGGLTLYQLGADERTVYYYAHLDRYAEGLAAGQAVTRGTVLGTVGDSGNAAPGNTHLHFAMWRVADPADFWEGEPINPYPLLGGR
ncbi:MAG: M23 family metallopeptidase [Rubricoccaceae bacterium]|nr:M23 family metallopeptidase [Rubricoccaceae bacterium]